MACCPPGSAPYLALDYACLGSVELADDVQYYHVGTGSVGLLVLPDVFGWNGGRTRALADEFAKRGLNVFLPKMLPPVGGGTDDDGLPPSFDNVRRSSEIVALLAGAWGAAHAMPKLQATVAAMRAAGVRKFGIFGLCYGAWVGFHLSSIVGGDELVCGASPHPSVHAELAVGGDPAALAAKCGCPWALYPCGVPGRPGGDPGMYDADGAVFMKLEERFPGQNRTRRITAMAHGFVSRGVIAGSQLAEDKAEQIKAAIRDCIDDVTAYFQTQGLLPGESKL